MAGITKPQPQKGNESAAGEAVAASACDGLTQQPGNACAPGSGQDAHANAADADDARGKPSTFANSAGAGCEHDADDARFMRCAIELAWRGAGWTSPNPLVGCVIVREGRVIGEGWHERYGQAHAERTALADCARRSGQGASGQPASPDDPAHGCAQGATAYVTLEPCCHTGKQPPCTEALIAAGIARVVVGSRDPNPLVAGKGCEALRAAGIRVDADVLRAACDELNSVFFHFITHKTPYVVAKWAMSADGKIACASGDARWITGPEARADVHELRHRLAAICVGIGTVLADDPLLTCRRDTPGSQPVREVLDSRLRIPEDCALVRSCSEGAAPLIVATCAPVADEASPEAAKAKRLASRGVEVLSVAPDAAGRVSVSHLLAMLGSCGIDSLLVEGGAGVLAAFFEAGAVNEAVVYMAPKVIGGAGAPSPVAGKGAPRMADAVALGRATSDVLGDDVKLMFAPAGAARVASQTRIARKAAGDWRASTAEGGAPCSPAS